MLARSARSLIRPSFSRLSSQLKFSSDAATSEQQKKSAEDTSKDAKSEDAGNNEVRQLKEKMTKCEADLADMKDRYLRAMAETENTRTRMRKEVENVKIYGIQGFCKDLLEVADVLNLAIANTDPSKDSSADPTDLKAKLKSMHNGLVMTETCLLKIFEKHGLVRILPKEGDKFDPNLHEAIFRVPIPDKESGSVNVLTKTGFKLHERVIRAAQVGVVQ